MITEIKCVICDEPATWMRYTQFAGNHPFCDKHAELETNFQPNSSIDDGDHNHSDSDWEKLDE